MPSTQTAFSTGYVQFFVRGHFQRVRARVRAPFGLQKEVLAIDSCAENASKARSQLRG